MKIRTPDCQCIIEEHGVTVIRSVGPTTYHAIKRMRQFIDAYLEEQRERSPLSNLSDDWAVGDHNPVQ